MTNTLKTTFLLASLSALLVFAGQLAGGRGGAIMAFAVAAVMNLVAYWFSDKIALAMHSAQPIEPGTQLRLESIVDRLVARAQLPRPRLYLIPQAQPNAFATGRNPQHAALAVTAGLLQLMNDEELEGVLAHELAHVRHRDILTSSIAATLAGAVMTLASIARWGAFFGGYGGRDDDNRGGGVIGLLVLMFVAPLAATLVQLGVSRSREFAADEGAAQLTGNPMGLARALHKLGNASGRIPMEASPQAAHMFIVSPLSGASMFKLFSTHPPLEERIERLVGQRPVWG